MDIRLLDDEIAAQLAKVRFDNYVMRFAFDNLKEKDAVLKGIEILKRHGLINTSRHLPIFYVYLDSDADYDSAYERVMILREIGVCPYVMPNQHCVRTRRMKDLIRWCNGKQLLWTMKLEEYDWDWTTKHRKGLV
jgi:hypothetical protein